MPEPVLHLDALSLWRMPLDDRCTSLKSIRDDGDRAFAVVLVIVGETRLGFSGSAHMLSAGDLAIVDEAADLPTISGEGSAVVVRIPSATAGPYAQALAESHGRVITAGSTMARIVSPLLREITEDSKQPTVNASRLAQHIVGLVGLMCTDGSSRDARSELLARARRYIEDNLGDVDLDPDAIASANNVSTRTLHRAFEADGMTIGGWIRSRRLEQCRVELADPQLAGLSVSAIGARWGLWDAAHFSRLFKSAHGLGPSAYRERELRNIVTHPRNQVRELVRTA